MAKIRQHNSTLSADPAKALKRKSELRPDPEQVRDWQDRSRQNAGRPKRRDPAPRRTRTDRERFAKLTTAFVQEVYEACGHRCAVCHYDGPHLQVHHVIEAERLKREFSDEGDGGWKLDELLYDPSNGLLLCSEPAPNRCHDRHTLAIRRVPRSCLRPANESFAERVNLVWVLDRFYPGDSPAASSEARETGVSA